MQQSNIQRFKKYRICPVCQTKVPILFSYCTNPECSFRLKFTYENIDPVNIGIEEIGKSLQEAGFHVEETDSVHNEKILLVDDNELQISFFVSIQRVKNNASFLQIYLNYGVKEIKNKIGFYKSLNESNQFTDSQVIFAYDEISNKLLIYSTIFLYAPLPTEQAILFFKLRILSIAKTIVESGLHNFLK